MINAPVSRKKDEDLSKMNGYCNNNMLKYFFTVPLVGRGDHDGFDDDHDDDGHNDD